MLTLPVSREVNAATSLLDYRSTSAPGLGPTKQLPFSSSPAESGPAPNRFADDSALVERAQSGDRVARDTLARRYRRPAYFLALQLLGNREDALDVAQEALLKFFLHLDRFAPDRPVLPWLRRIVRNGAVDLHRRKKVRRAESLDTSGPEGTGLEVEDPVADTQSSAELRQRQQVVWRCVQQLTPAQREMVVLRDYQDLSYTEIADALNVPLGTVMSRLHRARAELRRRVLSEILPETGATDTVAPRGGP